MDLTKLTLTSNTTYLVKDSPEAIYQKISHADGKPKNYIHRFTLENGDDIYINATYILSIEKVNSHITGMQSGSLKKDDAAAADEERIKGNLEAVREFKEDIDGNME